MNDPAVEDREVRILNPFKRCACCKKSRMEGAVIRFKSPYCNLCFAAYNRNRRRKKAKAK